MKAGMHLRARQGQVFRLGQVVSLLQMSAAELDAHLSETAKDNPMLVLRPRPAAMSVTDVLEMTAVVEVDSLYAHVSRELAGLLAQGGLMERVIMALIAELEPSGWLGRGPREIAQTLGLGADLIEAALRVVQKRVEPAGLFARDLQDCLRLQLEDRDAVNDGITTVLAHLEALERGGVTALASACGLEVAEVQQHLSILRRLDPKPGSGFASDATLMRAPDVRVTPLGDGWDIEFLSSLEGDFTVPTLPKGSDAACREAQAKARALKQALEIRRSALRQVVSEIVARQGGFFRFGPRALEPMTMSEIAGETGFHLSTVSRVLNGLLIEGPNGITAARTLFGGTASARATQSRPQVQARLRELLSAENPKHPLSDRRLTALLQAEGIAVSRRVVSNYRQEIGFEAAAKRRLRA